MYRLEGRIRFSEVDADERLSLSAIVNYFQDISILHSHDVGLSIDYFQQQQLAWILNSWQIHIEEYPKMGTRIEVQTWPYDFKNFYGKRNFVLYSEDKISIAYANSTWILMDLVKKRPAKIPVEMMNLYGGIEEPFSMPYEERKIVVPKSADELEPVKVKKHYIDTNNHMNNGRYIQIAREYLPEEILINKVKTEYCKAALLDDIIVPKIYHDKNQYIVIFYGINDEIYSIVEFQYKE